MTQATAYLTLLEPITKAAQKTPQLKPRPVHTPPKRARKQLNETSWNAFKRGYSGLS
jgi:hypothetical protein